MCGIFEFSDFAQKMWKKIRFKFENRETFLIEIPDFGGNSRRNHPEPEENFWKFPEGRRPEGNFQKFSEGEG